MLLDAAWRPLLADPGRAALFLDFDGSLAPIVDDPAAAVPTAGAVDAIVRLAGRLARVGVVTGRPVAFVRMHVPDSAVTIVGQYGLERDDGHGTTVDPRAAVYTAAVEAAATDAERRWPELTIERKAGVAVTVHWRTAPGRAPSPAALADLAGRNGLDLLPARMACELRPPLSIDKGTAVEGLLAGSDRALRAVAFAGDDQGDLAAFAALARWADTESGRAVVRVAVASDEVPPELRRQADLVVDGPVALNAQLRALADALE